jgi:hypothetical protein
MYKLDWGSVFLTAALVAVTQGCGGGSSSGPGTGASDACVPDSNLANLMVPDAAIGDAGVTVEDCYACVSNHCQSQLAACNVDCACNAAVSGLAPCIASGTKIGECANALLQERLGAAVWGCLDPNCIYTCSGRPDGG